MNFSMPAPHPPAKVPRLNKPRVLVAEDDPSIYHLLRRALDVKFSVVGAETGTQALRMARSAQPALLLLDVMLPGMTGFEVARNARKHPGLERVPIVFVTARDKPADVIEGIQAGARHYIAKPFSVSEVVRRVERALGWAPKQAS